MDFNYSRAVNWPTQSDRNTLKSKEKKLDLSTLHRNVFLRYSVEKLTCNSWGWGQKERGCSEKKTYKMTYFCSQPAGRGVRVKFYTMKVSTCINLGLPMAKKWRFLCCVLPMAHTKVYLHHFSMTDDSGDRKLNQRAQKHFSQLSLPGIIFSSKNEELKLRISHLMISVRKKCSHKMLLFTVYHQTKCTGGFIFFKT